MTIRSALAIWFALLAFCVYAESVSADENANASSNLAEPTVPIEAAPAKPQTPEGGYCHCSAGEILSCLSCQCGD